MEQEQANFSVRTEDAGLDRVGADPEPVDARQPHGQDLATSEGQPPVDALAWMVNVGGEETIEMCYADIEAAWRAGRIDGATLVWRETMADWTPIGAVPLLNMGLPAPQRSAGPLPTGPSEQRASRPSPPSADPHSSDFAAAKRRRRSSLSGVPSSKPGPRLVSDGAAPGSPSATFGPVAPRSNDAAPSSPSATLGPITPRSNDAAPSSPSAVPFSVKASLTELTMQAMAMVDPHSDDLERPNSPWALKSARPGMAAPSAPGSAADPSTAERDAPALGDATFEKDFEELWAGGLDPNPTERAASGTAASAAATDPNFEADFAALWAQGPEPTSAVTGKDHDALAARDRTQGSPTEGAAEPPTAEQAVQATARSEPELEGADRIEAPRPTDATPSSDERAREPHVDQPGSMSGSAALGVPPGRLSLRAASEAHRPSSDDVLSSGEREALVPPSEPKPKSGPSIESLRDLRPVPPREPSHLPPAPIAALPPSPAMGTGSGHAVALDSGSGRGEAASGTASAEHARLSGTHPPGMRPPPPRSPAARQAAGTPRDASSADKGEARRSSLPSPSRPSVTAGGPLAPSALSPALGSSPSLPSGPRPAVAAPGDSRPIAIFERPSATLVFGDAPPAAAVKSGPPPFPTPSSSATASLAPSSSTAASPVPTPAPSQPTPSPVPTPAPSQLNATLSPVPSPAPSQSSATPSALPSVPVSPVSPDFGEEEFVAALKRGRRWSVRALAATGSGPWASLKGNANLSRKAVIGVAAGAVFILAFVLSVANSSDDSTESASSQDPSSPAGAQAPASPRVPSDPAASTSETERDSQEAPSQSGLSRAMKKALTGRSRTPASQRGRAATADRTPRSNEDLDHELDRTLKDWSSGTALPKDEVAPPRTTKPPASVARRPQSRTQRPGSKVPPPSFDVGDSSPKKTAWDPTNPGF